ncbi:hypothetical protein [Brenneria goodwinii]|uniref:hypothetical protein n=1 Tax=Brenneria goodwinii TaxID=1109412 RepID=UPI0036E8E962
MSSNREIALEQALVAVLAAAKELSIDINDLVAKANGVIINSAHKNNIIDDKHIRVDAGEIIQSLSAQI